MKIFKLQYFTYILFTCLKEIKYFKTPIRENIYVILTLKFYNKLMHFDAKTNNTKLELLYKYFDTLYIR